MAFRRALQQSFIYALRKYFPGARDTFPDPEIVFPNLDEVDRWYYLNEILHPTDSEPSLNISSFFPAELQSYVKRYLQNGETPIYATAFQIDPSNFRQYHPLVDKGFIKIYTQVELEKLQVEANLTSKKLDLPECDLQLYSLDFETMNCPSTDLSPDTHFMVINPEACTIINSPNPQ